jgi:hypothetical protein
MVLGQSWGITSPKRLAGEPSPPFRLLANLTGLPG